jgi:hypothetical protein
LGRTRIFGAALAVLMLLAVPASADSQGFIEDEFDYGFFYGTFDESPNTALFAGGTLEEFCFSDPGVAPLRVFLKHDGTVDLKVNAKGQPIYLYETDYNDIPVWLDAVCPGIAGGAAAPEPFAVGVADLKVRISEISPERVEIFNSVNGMATGTDGREYKVRGTADLVVENGVPIGDPREFVGFKLTEIRR